MMSASLAEDHRPTPRFVYVVLAHTGTDAVVRLVRRIRVLSPSAEVLVRYGAEADLDGAALRAGGASVLESALTVEWGTFSQADAEIEALGQARSRFPDATHFVVISGQDYPVRDLAVWEAEVAGSGVDALLEPMPITQVSVDRRWFVVRGPQLPAVVRKVVAAVGYRLPKFTADQVHVNPSPRDGDGRWWVGVPRATRRGLTKAATWKTLSATAVDVLTASLQADPDRAEYIRRCRLPDELYSPTVLAADPALKVVDGLTSFTSWSHEAASPDWLTTDHVPAVVASGAPFARKLPARASADLLAALDALASSSMSGQVGCDERPVPAAG